MLKRIQESFSLKIFFITWAVLIFSNLLVLVGVYAFMPQIYTISYNESIHACMEEMEENLPRIRREESGDFFNELCEKYQIKLDIYDTYTYKRPEIPGIDKNYLCQIPESYSSAQEGAIVSQYSYGPDNERAVAMNGEKIEYSILSLSFSDCGPYEFALIPPRENKVNIFLSDLKRILPYLTSVIFLLAFAMGAVYTRYITGPVLRISRAAKAMSRMDWKNSRLSFRRKDEIGSLARSIDSTSHTLEQVLSQRDEANEMLRRELEKQKKLDQEQQEFFAAASHELMTPVTVLKGQLTGMLYQVGAYQDRDLYLKKSLKTVEEMESRILKILEVSRMERADRKAEIRKLELSKILRESYEPYEDLIEDKGLRLQVSLPDSFKVLGDPKLLKSALENILENAVKYSPPGEEIRISVRKEQEDPEYCRLAVENTGVWIPKEKIPRLFQAFYRVEGSRNKETGGSGLGLYLVKRALELQKIPYKAENTEDGFCICLRLKRNFTEIGGISECTNGSS